MDGYMRGVNLGGWLSQFDAPTKEHFDTFITKEDIRRIAGMGLDHVRVPVDYTVIETEDGVPKEEGYQYIDKCVQWCRENGLHQDHIDQGPAEDAQEGAPFPGLQSDDCQAGDELRSAERRPGQHGILQAVDHQHPDDGGRKDFPEINDIRRRLLPEQQERQETQQHGHGRHHSDQQGGMCIHTAFLPGFPLRRVSMNVISSMAGIRKPSGPNSRRHSSVERSPVTAGRCSRVRIHCSVKEAINRAVMENSIPAEENGSTAPSRLPRTHPVIQYI